MGQGAARFMQAIQDCILLTFSRFILLCQKHKKISPPPPSKTFDTQSTGSFTYTKN